jgi:UDP-N-acetylmuramyl pentapeptide phosphotransferase/UDP-N-acetylglucosamine-1-phosphate transferase
MLAKTHLAAFALSLLSAALLAPAVRRLAGELRLAAGGADEPATPGPRLGGVAVALAFFVPVAALLVYLNPVGCALLEKASCLWALFAGGATIIALGVYEDVRGPTSSVQLGGQILVSVAAFALGVRVDTIIVPGAGVVELGVYAFPATLLWFVAIMSAVDTLADLDALAPAAYLFSALLILLVSLHGGLVVQGLFAAALAGAVLGFLFRALGPQTSSMGDTGSHFVGYVLALVSVSSVSKGATVVAVLTPLLALGLPAGQASTAVWERLRAILPVSRGGATLLCVAGASLGAAALLAELASDLLAGGLLLMGAAVGFALLRLLSLGRAHSLRRAAGHDADADDEAYDQLRASGRAVRDAAGVEEAWEHLLEASRLLGIHALDLDLYVSEDGAQDLERSMHFAAEGRDTAARTVRLSIPLMDRRFLYGELAFTCSAAGNLDDRRRAFLYLMAEHLAELLGRIYHERAEQVFTVHRHTR